MNHRVVKLLLLWVFFGISTLAGGALAESPRAATTIGGTDRTVTARSSDSPADKSRTTFSPSSSILLNSDRGTKLLKEFTATTQFLCQGYNPPAGDHALLQWLERQPAHVKNICVYSPLFEARETAARMLRQISSDHPHVIDEKWDRYHLRAGWWNNTRKFENANIKDAAIQYIILTEALQKTLKKLQAQFQKFNSRIDSTAASKQFPVALSALDNRSLPLRMLRYANAIECQRHQMQCWSEKAYMYDEIKALWEPFFPRVKKIFDTLGAHYFPIPIEVNEINQTVDVDKLLRRTSLNIDAVSVLIAFKAEKFATQIQDYVFELFQLVSVSKQIEGDSNFRDAIISTIVLNDLAENLVFAFTPAVLDTSRKQNRCTSAFCKSASLGVKDHISDVERFLKGSKIR